MAKTALKVLAGLAALAALALGGSALAGAASSSSNSSQSGAALGAAPYGTAYGGPPAGGPGPGRPGAHIGANGKQETPLTGDTATKVKDAALAKVPGGTLERVETDVDHGSPYEAHIRKSDGTELEVLVNKDFQVTAVNTMRMR